MPRQSQSSTTMLSEPSALRLGLDSETLFGDEVSPLNLVREEKRSSYNRLSVEMKLHSCREGDSSSKWKVPHWKSVNPSAFMRTNPS